jgi:glutamine synthetase
MAFASGCEATLFCDKLTDKFMNLKGGAIDKRIQAEYIWIGGSGEDLRSKGKTLEGPIKSIEDLPDWDFDGSSTGQAKGTYSEIWLKPVKYIKDPFRGGENILVLCECLDAKNMQPVETNRRAHASKIFNNKKVAQQHPWFGMEQEYVFFDVKTRRPLGWPSVGFPAPQGPYYCGVGAAKVFGRPIVEAHYKACLYAGIPIAGINAEVMPAQWEFQIGPCEGIEAADYLWLARYLLFRIAEEFGVSISLEPKPILGDWNGTGCHTNYSTQAMREKDGYKHIMEAIDRLGKNHEKHMKQYGKRNRRRLTGHHETAKFEEFSFGVANRGASVRIPRKCEIAQKGYLEDRRPAANCDPYAVTAAMAETTLLD